MAQAIEKQERTKTKDRWSLDSTKTPRRAKKNSLDSADVQSRRDKVLEWRRQARISQAENRFEMAKDQDYYDGIQWSEEDKEIVEGRGQTACVFNLVATTLRWVTGTEKRTRVDYRVMPRHADDRKGSESKTSLLKYLADVNKLAFERSRAFADSTTVGLGWLEDGIRSDSEEEPLFARFESWRNMWYDPLSIAPDMSDARFLFREKWVDLDVAVLMFPDRARDLEIAASNVISVNQINREMGNPYLYDDPAATGLLHGSPTDLLGCGTRQRVLLCEAWYRVPVKAKVIRQAGETYNGAIYNQADPIHAWAAENGLASTHDAIKMQMRLMVMCISGQGGMVLQDAVSPYWHNKFPFTPVWGYRRGRDNAPYGVVRGIRDPQDDLNKRRSKALYLLNSKQVVADKGAVDDVDEAMDEIARPDGWIEKNPGKELSIQPQAQLAAGHVQMLDQDARFIQESAGVTDENLGRQTNAISGKAIESRQNQGYTTTSDLFDNLRLAIQITGERQLSLIEQFYDQPKQLRISGERKSDINFVALNGEDGLNPITKSQADFVVDEQDFRGTQRQAMFDSMLEMVAKIPDPVTGLKLLAIAFEASDLPMKDEFMKVLRDVTGMQDPNAEEDPAAAQAKAEQAQQEQAAQAQAQEQQNIAMELMQKKALADIALIEGKAKEAIAKGNKAELEALLAKLKILADSMSLAGSAAVAPELTAAADQIVSDVTVVPTVNNVAPPLPDGVQQTMTMGTEAPGTPADRITA
jgi:hypothetical protein